MTGTVLFVFAERAVPAASVGFRGRLIYPEICVVLHSQLSSAHPPPFILGLHRSNPLVEIAQFPAFIKNKIVDFRRIYSNQIYAF